MKYSIDFTNKFKKSLRKGVKRGLDPVLMEKAVQKLSNEGKLPPSYKSHKLHGNLEGIWECHISRSVRNHQVSVLPVKWALRDQAMGTQGPRDGHSGTKGRAFIAHAVCTQCPKVGQFLGTLYRSAALLLCIIPHTDFVILR